MDDSKNFIKGGCSIDRIDCLRVAATKHKMCWHTSPHMGFNTLW